MVDEEKAVRGSCHILNLYQLLLLLYYFIFIYYRFQSKQLSLNMCHIGDGGPGAARIDPIPIPGVIR
jgi:hypothetical protein